MTIKNKVLHSLKWLMISQLLSQLVRWGITFFVIRLLSSEDYGLMAIADVMISLLMLLSSAGLASSIVQAKSYTEAQLRSLMTLLLLVNVGIITLVAVAAPTIADFYGDDRLVTIFYWMILGFILGLFEALPLALLSRQMRFKTLSLIDLLAGLISGVATLIFALQGFSYYALLYGYLINIGLRSVLKNIALGRLIIPSFSLLPAMSLVKFGGTVTLVSLLWLFYTRYDVLIAGRLWDAELLGFYVIAMQIALMPLEKVISLFQAVAFPAYASEATNPERFKFYVLKVNRLSMQIIFPVFFGMSLIAPLIIPLLLGDKWQKVVLPLQIITLILPLRVSMELMSVALKGKGLSGILFKEMLTTLCIMIPALTLGVYYDLFGLALAWLLAYPVVYLINTRRSLLVLGINSRLFVKEMLPILGISLLMLLFGYLSLNFMIVSLDEWLQLFFILIQSFVIYYSLIYFFLKDGFFELWGLVKK